ncbi:hypothetical protein [Gordonia sp. CPCC 205333]|uniref:hypothetical protein n=1 Tax=Gordonia sp. CPCC 205333 TaxID=3140790 RepID=UPI003AF34303
MIAERGRMAWPLVAALAMVVTLGTACSVDGASHPDISARMVDAADFPAGLTPTTVVGPARAALVSDVVGDVQGGRVEPDSCAPTPLSSNPADSAAMVAQLSASSVLPGTLTVVTTRVSTPLSDLENQVGQCKSYVRTNAAGASSTVRQTIIDLAEPSIPGVSTLGIARTQTTGGSATGGQGESAVGVASKTYVAQRDGVRVYVVYRGVATTDAANAEPTQVASVSTPDLDALFVKAVSASFA